MSGSAITPAVVIGGAGMLVTGFNGGLTLSIARLQSGTAQSIVVDTGNTLTFGAGVQVLSSTAVSITGSGSAQFNPGTALSFAGSFFFLLIRSPPRSTLFPYTTLFRFIGRRKTSYWRQPKRPRNFRAARFPAAKEPRPLPPLPTAGALFMKRGLNAIPSCGAMRLVFEDRKSTRLNSSHLGISYAVFCLK